MNAKDIIMKTERKFQVLELWVVQYSINWINCHPINFGIKSNSLPTFRNNTIFMKPDKNSFNNPINIVTSLLSGYISKENTELLKKSVPFKIKRYGSGKIFLFSDNTNFRAFWYGTNRL